MVLNGSSRQIAHRSKYGHGHVRFRKKGRALCLVITHFCGEGSGPIHMQAAVVPSMPHPRALSPANLTALDRHPPITIRTTTAPATRHLPNVQALRSTRRAPGLAAALHSRGFLTAAAYKLAQKQMPKMSETEKVALGCGTVGSDLC